MIIPTAAAVMAPKVAQPKYRSSRGFTRFRSLNPLPFATFWVDRCFLAVMRSAESKESQILTIPIIPMDLFDA